MPETVLDAMRRGSENRCLYRLGVCLTILLLGSYALVFGADRDSPGGKAMSFQLSTTAFPANKTIPHRFTCDGQDISPALEWSDVPAGTKAFALVVDDPDAPAGTWNHWLMWNMPASARGLPEGVPKNAQFGDGARQGRNDFGKLGYNGPCPPPGKPHRYYFRLYALDSALELQPGGGRKELDAAMSSHIVGRATLIGLYGR